MDEFSKVEVSTKECEFILDHLELSSHIFVSLLALTACASLTRVPQITSSQNVSTVRVPALYYGCFKDILLLFYVTPAGGTSVLKIVVYS
jgi:hypothetical protein